MFVQVELSVRFGKTLLVLEADGLDAALYPLCRRDLIHQVLHPHPSHSTPVSMYMHFDLTL